MTPSELTAFTAILSSTITALASLGVVWNQERLRGRAAAKSAKETAVAAILTRSLDVALKAKSAGDTAKRRSGLSEGFSTLIGLQKPIDAFVFHDWLHQDLRPLNEANAAVWLSADQFTIRLANQVVAKCCELLGVSTEREPATTAPERIRRLIAGEKWTTPMLDAHEAAVTELAQARQALADHARKTLGQKTVDLFAHA